MSCGEGSIRSMPDPAQRLRGLLDAGKLDLPPPGHGHTGDRHRALLEFAREDLALARLIEAHTDAMAIAHEAGVSLREGSLYGVWASDGPASRLDVERMNGGSMRLRGVKQFCTGATFLDAALVTAYEGTQRILLEVPLNTPGVTRDASAWSTPAFAETVTATVNFSGVVVKGAVVVGAADWYLARPGFWHGALGPAACWAGGAIALIDAVCRRPKEDVHWRVHMGALHASEWALRAILAEAGRQIDADPEDRRGDARTRALIARHLIERICTEVMDRFGRVTGPRLLAFDADIAKLYSELTLYVRQCHSEADLEQIAARRAPELRRGAVQESSDNAIRKD
jgi:alkylation response protein AidB-like acyl-CoA dehydrogenase